MHIHPLSAWNPTRSIAYMKKINICITCISLGDGYSSRVFQKINVHSPPSLGKFLRQDSPRNKVRTSPVATVSQRCLFIITYKLIKSTVFVKINKLMAEFFNVSQGGVGGVCEIKWRVGAQEVQGSNLMVNGFNKILKIQTVFCDIFFG